MEVKLEQSIDYKQSLKRDSYYKFTKIVQNTGSERLTIAGTAQQVSTFELPAVGFNLARSHINFLQYSDTAQQATFSPFFYRHVVPWSRLELFTRGGTYLADITNCAEFTLATLSRTKNFTEVFTCQEGILTAAPTGFKILQQGPTNAVMTVANAVRWRIGGRELYNTIMSLDKTIMLGEVLTLRITWREGQAQAYKATAADATGQTGAVNLEGSVIIDSLALYLAQETNPSVLADLQSVISSQGMSVLIPYTYVYKTNITNSSSHAVSIRLSRGHGISVERIHTLFMTGAEATNTRYVAEIDNAGGLAPIFNSFYTLLDSRRLMEFDVNVPAVDYRWLREREYQDKVINFNPDLYDNNMFAWTDNFCGIDTECAVKQHMGGLSLDQEKKYDLYVQLAGANTVNYYTIAVCQRQLMVSPAGVQVV